MSLMKRVSERDSTAIPETQASSKESAQTPQSPHQTASRVRGGKAADLYSVLQDVQRRMMVESDGVINLKDHALMRQTIDELMNVILAEQGIMLNKAGKQEFLEQLINEILGFGPLEQLLDDIGTTDIMVIGPERVYVERKGKLMKTNVQFQDNQHLMRIIDRILAPLGRRVDETSPMVDARLPDGSRVNVIVPPVALDGAALTIRKFAVTPLTVNDLIEFGTATPEVFEFLEGAVLAGMNVIVAGGSSSGKTTLLNVLSGYVPQNERIVTIENAAELQLRQDHVVRMESRPANMEGVGEVSVRDLMINSLRMRPDRIVVGEVRSGEAIDLLQAMNTGHEGSMGTLHANSPQDSLSRLETMVLSAGMNLPVRAIRDQMASAINLIIHMGRDREGVRRILTISEVNGLEGDIISLSEIFRFERTPGAGDGVLVATGLIPRCMERISDAGMRLSAAIFQPSAHSSSGRVKTVESSSGSRSSDSYQQSTPVYAEPAAPMRHPEPSYQQPPAPQAAPVEYASMDEIYAQTGEDYPLDTQSDVPVQWPESANPLSGQLRSKGQMLEAGDQQQAQQEAQQQALPAAVEPEPTPEPESEEEQERSPGITDSQQIRRGLLGRIGSNQGLGDHDVT